MGIVIANYTIPRLSTVLLATADGAGVMNWGMREPASIVATADTQPSVQFPEPDRHAYRVQLTSRQTRFQDFANAYNLVASGPHALYAQSAGSSGRKIFFTDNDSSGTFTNPVGTSLLGANISFVVGQDTRSLSYIGETWMAQTETNFMYTNSPAFPTVQAGSGVYLHPYDQASFRRRGISFISINSVKYPIFSGGQLTLATQEAQQGGRDFRNRPYPSTLKTSFTGMILCTDYTSLAALNAAEQAAVPLQVGTWADETVTWNSGAASFMVSNRTHSDSGWVAQISIQADATMDPSAVSVTPNAITISLVE